jgi:L-iditol 2-dehydrogenase
VAILGAPGDVERRFKKAADLGFTKLINVGETNPVEAVLALTSGRGADVLVECSGAPKAIAGMVDMVRKKARICVIGLTGGKTVELPWDKFSFKVLDVIFNLSTSHTSWDRSISLIASGRVPAEQVITHRGSLNQWEELFDAVESLKALKALIIPT